MDMDKNFIRKLEQTKADINQLKPGDQEMLIKIGINLEELLSTTSHEMLTSRTVLRLCLESLQAIYENKVDDFDNIVISINDAIVSLIRYLQSEDKKQAELATKTAWQKLWDTISRNRGSSAKPAYRGSFDEADNDEEFSKLNIDDVAALMVQMEASDQKGLTKIKAALENIQKRNSVSSKTKTFIEQAVNELANLLKDNPEDPDSIYANVSRLIENAIEALDDNTLVETQEMTEVSSQPPAAKAPNVAETTVFKPLPPDSDIALLTEFITESKEYIENAESALLTLETNPEDIEAIHVVFRAFHTIKGNAAFLGLDEMNLFAHNAETFYCRIRDKEIRCVGGYADLSFRAIDVLKELVNNLESTLNDNPFLKPDLFDKVMQELVAPEANGISETTSASASADQINATATDSNKVVDKNGLNSDLQLSGPVSPAPESPKPNKEKANSKSGGTKSKHKADSIVRVQTERLDRLIDMVGELVIAQSMVTQDTTVIKSENQELLKKVAHTGTIVRELQDLTMNLRMVPLKPTFNKMARLMRDLARKVQKDVNFLTEGEDVEIDRNMVEVINDPLVHILRNSVDHGMEVPDEREKAGKNREGRVHLRAFHSGGNVVVEIEDDGRGLNKQKILSKAIAKGIIESGNNLSDHEIFNLIFEPGFTTAAKITDISGRGVGLDVVKKGVEALRGRIDVHSVEGKGTTFTLRIPITLAVTDGMLVKVGAQRYIVPIININMSFRPEPNSLSTYQGRGEMVMLRDKLLPIFRLHHLFKIDDAIEDPQEGLLVVLDDGNGGCALLVDELLGQQQVVAKSLGEAIGKVKGVSGGAILGDGRVGLILDTSEIIELAKN